MNSHDFVFSKTAADTFMQIIMDMQQVSLLSAEKVRKRIIHKLHLIQHQPMQSSKEVTMSGLKGHYRSASVLNFKIFYMVEENRICVVDILMDKEVKTV